MNTPRMNREKPYLSLVGTKLNTLEFKQLVWVARAKLVSDLLGYIDYTAIRKADHMANQVHGHCQHQEYRICYEFLRIFTNLLNYGLLIK